MPKYLHLTNELKQDITNKFLEQLNTQHLSSNKFTFSTDITDLKDIETPMVYFTPEAYCKLKILVEKTLTEIGWHGVCEKDTEDNSYTITDIILYPQTVTAATVVTNDAEYGTWLMQQPDEIFNKIRFQGHSHVNMPTRPSAVDEAYYEALTSTIPKNEYYIFMVINKKNDIYMRIYDFARNLLFEDKDIECAVLSDDGRDLEIWADLQKKQHIKTYTPNTLGNTINPNFDPPNLDKIIEKYRGYNSKFDDEAALRDYYNGEDTAFYAGQDLKKKAKQSKKKKKEKKEIDLEKIIETNFSQNPDVILHAHLTRPDIHFQQLRKEYL